LAHAYRATEGVPITAGSDVANTFAISNNGLSTMQQRLWVFYQELNKAKFEQPAFFLP
jgi:hypothetical protein